MYAVSNDLDFEARHMLCIVEIIHAVEIDICMYKILGETKPMPAETLAGNSSPFLLCCQFPDNSRDNINLLHVE